MIQYYVVIMIVWLSPKDGSIIARNVGFAVDVPHCESIAQMNIGQQIALKDPQLNGAVPKYACWDTRASSGGKSTKPAKGEVSL
jgi:hypothetical protein